jgi:RNA polymerase sigma factor for flagellar operon FliA
MRILEDMNAITATGVDEAQIIEHMPLVGYVVHEIAARLPRHVDHSELHSAGYLGLVQAAKSFEASHGVPFRRYANMRIRGAVMDELRQRSWASRSVRQLGRLREEAVSHLASVLGRMPAQEEIAAHLGVPVSELVALDDDLHRTVVLSMDAAPSMDVLEPALPHDAETPETELLRGEEHRYLHAAVESLPERLRVVVTMYYLQGRPMADIATALDVSESRVSQMRAQALELVKDGMNSQLDPQRVSDVDRPGGVVDRRRSTYFAAVARAGDVRRMAARQAHPASGVPAQGARAKVARAAVPAQAGAQRARLSRTA